MPRPIAIGRNFPSVFVVWLYYFRLCGRDVADVRESDPPLRWIGEYGYIPDLIVFIVAERDVSVMRILPEAPNLLSPALVAFKCGDLLEAALSVGFAHPDGKAKEIRGHVPSGPVAPKRGT